MTSCWLWKKSLKELLLSNAVADWDGVGSFCSNFFSLNYSKLDAGQLQQLKDWESKLCVPDGAAVWSTVAEAFEHLTAMIDEHFDELVAVQKLSLDAVFNSRASRDKPVWGSFGKNFLSRHCQRLDDKQLEHWKDWE